LLHRESPGKDPKRGGKGVEELKRRTGKPSSRHKSPTGRIIETWGGGIKGEVPKPLGTLGEVVSTSKGDRTPSPLKGEGGLRGEKD